MNAKDQKMGKILLGSVLRSSEHGGGSLACPATIQSVVGENVQEGLLHVDTLPIKLHPIGSLFGLLHLTVCWRKLKTRLFHPSQLCLIVLYSLSLGD